MSPWEKVSLFSAIALVLVPAINLLLTVVLRHTNPLIAWTLVVAAAVIFYRYIHPATIRLPHRRNAWPLFAGIALQLSLSIVLFSAFLALPDVDPYHWVKVYQQNYLGDLTTLPQRPLFHSLVHLLEVISGLNPEQVFKFAIPLLSLTMLIPAWLVARRFTSRLNQFIILLFPYLSPALIISTQMGTPQAILIISTSYFVFFLIYAHLTEQKIWHYLAGALMAATILYHGLATLLFAIWLFATIWHSSKRSYALIAVVLIFFVSLPYLRSFVSPALQNVQLNLTYPKSFTTIDGVPNGWPGLAGFTKYYAFYASPALLALLTLTIYQLRHASYRQRMKKLLGAPSTLTIIATLFVFFTIAEIIPRLLNIIILPDRAWLFIALFSPILLLPLLKTRITLNRLWPAAAFVLIALNIGGALYVNNLKQHIIPDYAITSARWINNNLPGNSLVFSDHGPDYLDLYISQEIRSLPPATLCQADLSALTTAKSDTSPTHLFYYQVDQANPYHDRPWQLSSPRLCSPDKLIQQNPSAFQPVYQDGQQAFVWQIQ